MRYTYIVSLVDYLCSLIDLLFQILKSVVGRQTQLSNDDFAWYCLFCWCCWLIHVFVIRRLHVDCEVLQGHGEKLFYAKVWDIVLLRHFWCLLDWISSSLEIFIWLCYLLMVILFLGRVTSRWWFLGLFGKQSFILCQYYYWDLVFATVFDWEQAYH